MNPAHEYHQLQNRRQFFQGAGLKLGGIAVAQLLGQRAMAQTASNMHPALPGLPHFAPKAKRLIYLHMNGAPSQIDLFDHKPRLTDFFDKELPDSIRNGQRITTMTSGQKRFPVAPSKFAFERCGTSGIEMSELVPHMKGIADDITMIRSVHTEAINHDPACTFVMTGSEVPGKPSLGSWLSYGLGSESQNLPAFVVLTPMVKKPSQALFTRMWSSGFLPTKFDGVKLRGSGDPVLFVKNPPGVLPGDRRTMLDALGQLNQKTFERFGDPETQTRIAQYEMAFRMQAAAPEIVDLSDEPESTFKLYGEDARRPGTYAYNCLLARRLAERDVRFVQLFHRGWDQHGSLVPHLTAQCKDTDQASAALVTDLEQRGLLEDTLVIWGGEFGRTSYSQGGLGNGRDHHGRCFSIWMAGGGIKRGGVHGATDEYCYNIVKDPVHINDMNATILHCMGIDHERFTFKFQGLNTRLTGVEEAHAIKQILA